MNLNEKWQIQRSGKQQSHAIRVSMFSEGREKEREKSTHELFQTCQTPVVSEEVLAGTKIPGGGRRERDYT